jgi:xylan 1,4-beta-xylosidase
MPDQYDFFNREEPGPQWEMPLGGDWSIENNEYLYQNFTPEKSQNMFIAVLDSSTNADYTAEFNFREHSALNEHPKMGAVFEYVDPHNFNYVIVNSNTNTLEINSIRDNIHGTPIIENMPGDFDYSVWHVIRVEKVGSTGKFFFDGLHIKTISLAPGGGKIGYLSENCHAHFGFIAFSNKVNGSGVFDIYKPIPGTIDAVLYNSGGQGTGYMQNEIGLTGPNELRQDGLPIIPNTRGGFAIEGLASGEWLKYNVNIRSESTYNFAVTYASNKPENSLRIWIGDKEHKNMIHLDGTGGESKFRTVVIKDINLPSGYHTLKLQMETGTINLYDMKFVFADNTDFDMSTNFESTFDINWRYTDGAWTIAENMATIDGFGKRTYGNPYWIDYMVETNLRFLRSMNAGMILRVNNPALGGAGDSPHHGTDYLQGYFIGFNFSTLVLGKHNYGWQPLTSASGQYEMNRWYHLRAIIEGDRIKVYVDDMNTPVINYVDSMPFINGRPGLRSFNTHVQFENFRVTSNTSPTSVSDTFHYEGLQENPTIYPNPALNRVTVLINGELINQIQLLGLDGKERRRLYVNNFHADFPLEGLPPGMYLLRIYGENRTYNSKLIVNN